MTVLDIIKNRHSVRKYLDKPVEDEKLNQILEAARLAPSSTNSQPWHFVVIKNKELIKQVEHAVPLGVTALNKFLEEAPIIIAGCVKPTFVQKITAAMGRYNHIIDLSIAMEHMVLVASDIGLGTCWIGWFDESKVKKILNVPRDSKIVAMLALGYPDPDASHSTTRKDMRDIYSIDKY